jgi:hypothetical protein
LAASETGRTLIAAAIDIFFARPAPKKREGGKSRDFFQEKITAQNK